MMKLYLNNFQEYLSVVTIVRTVIIAERNTSFYQQKKHPVDV